MFWHLFYDLLIFATYLVVVWHSHMVKEKYISREIQPQGNRESNCKFKGSNML